MLRPIPDLPAGVLGFEAVGEVHADDYRDVLRPAVDRAVGRGEVRLVLVLGDEFTGYTAGAAWEDAKLGFDHHAAWVRTAFVSDLDWVRHLTAAVGWLVPGDVRSFPLQDREEAVRWTAGEPPVPDPATEPTPAVAPTVVISNNELPRYQTLTPRAPLNPNAEVRAGIVAGPTPPSAPAVPAQWAPDPYGRHQHRWWDGERWTAYVGDNGMTSTDPFG
ncbi:MAG TPA: STAS/SEC14 domain-containing protein [Acidimicrobiales bacterium]